MRSVTHLVVTDNFAGVERYVTTVAAETAARGWVVRVLGGREQQMRALLPPGVEWAPAPSLVRASYDMTRNRSDVVHAHMTKAELAAALVPRRQAIVATRHFAAPRGRNRLVAAATGLVARRLDVELAISDTVRRASEVASMPVLLNAVPSTEVARRPARTVVVAQRWEEEKRTVDAIGAFGASGLADQGWRLVIHGAGSQEPTLRRAALASRVADSIDVAGFADDMPRVFAEAGMLLATATHEPFGLGVAEAMAAGTPVVATGSGGHLETVGRVPEPALYAPGDVDGCAVLLADLGSRSLTDREEYGSVLRAWARTHLSVERHVSELISHYDHALTQHTTSGAR